MRLDVLHVDQCPNLPPLLARLAEATDLPVTTVLVASDAEAAEYGMAGSPTLLINGVDPFAGPEPGENGVSCRLYRDESGGLVPIPTVGQLRAAINRTAITRPDGAPPTSPAAAALRAWWRSCAVALGPVEKAVRQQILITFAVTGRPPTTADLAPLAIDGRDIEEVLAELHRLDTIRLDRGRIAVAYPFSAAETRHRVRIGGPGGLAVFAMCAVDALGISAMLGGRETVIESVDAASGDPITVTTRAGRTRWQPAGAVVFVSTAAGSGPSADCCCGDLNFFTDPASARAWTTSHPEVAGQLLDQDDAERLAGDLFGHLLIHRPDPEGSS
jgi:hypothetical protein